MIITICVLNLQELDSPDAKKILDLERFLEGIRTLQQLAFSALFSASFFVVTLNYLLTKDYFIQWSVTLSLTLPL